MTDRLPGLKFVLFSLVCLVAAAWVASVTGNLRRIPFLDDRRQYEAVLEDASGLAVGDDVRLAGVRVGRVNGVTLERGDAVVAFEVDDALVEPRDDWETGARWRNVIGQRYLYLYPGADDGAVLQPGARIPVERSRVTADIGRFFNEITPLLEALDPDAQNRLLTALNETLVDRTDTVQSLVVELASLSDTLADREPEIRAVIQNANLLLASYNEREGELTAFIDELGGVASTLATRDDELFAAVEDIAVVQERLGDLLEANDAGLRRSIDNLRLVTDSIAGQRVDFEESLANTRQGFATYMLISRWGQWFNVRAVATQVQTADGEVVNCQTEGGGTCNWPNSANSGSAAAASSGSPPAVPASAGAAAAAPVLRGPQRLDALEVITGLPLLRADVATRSAGGSARDVSQAGGAAEAGS